VGGWLGRCANEHYAAYFYLGDAPQGRCLGDHGRTNNILFSEAVSVAPALTQGQPSLTDSTPTCRSFSRPDKLPLAASDYPGRRAFTTEQDSQEVAWRTITC
jgi:hypothetical protein